MSQTTPDKGRASLNPSTLRVAGLVCVAGVVAGCDMLLGWREVRTVEWRALTAFALLGIGWALLSFELARRGRSKVAVALAPVAFQALFPLARPAVVATVVIAVLGTEWLVQRRGLVQGLFNVAQYLIGAWFGVHAAAAVMVRLPGLGGIAVGALAGGAAVSVSSVALTQAVLWLSTGRNPAQTGVVSFSTLSNEVVITTFAALLAVAWSVHQALLMVPVVPLTLLFLLLSRLESREQHLRRQQKELEAIQELGLKMSARLDGAELGGEITRIVAEDLRARGAMLLLLEEDGAVFRIPALFERAAAPRETPRAVPRRGFDEAFMARREALWGDLRQRPEFAELTVVDANAFLAQPLAVLGRDAAVLVVFDDGTREPFGADDAHRLAGLVRFIEVALNNARLYDDLRRMQQQLVETEKLSAIGQLVSGVAHELNNPLATIMGTAELFAEHDLPATVRPMVGRIQRESARAARIVRSLLMFSRRHRPEIGWHDLGAIVAEVVDLRASDCRARDIALLTDVDPRMPLVRVDQHQLHQVLLNLVTNAEQALAELNRPGRIVVRTGYDATAGCVHLEVSDDGPGIPPDALGKIFNPFFTTKPIGKGTGLGLSICYGIVKEHGGSIVVSSPPGEGATFSIDLPAPAGAPPAAAPAPLPLSNAGRGGPVHAGRRALVVDDEEGVRAVLVEALSVRGFTVDEGQSGIEGLEHLRRTRYDVAVVDLRMPGLDGLGLWKKARAEGLALPPLIFSTGDAVHPGAREFLDHVAAPVLVKPFTLAALWDCVEGALADDAVRV